MTTIKRTITVARPLDTVFDYLSDFTTTTQWDPGTVDTVRVNGDGGVDTEYLNTSKFVGRETELTYVVERLVRGEVIALRGENRTVVAHDTMTFRRVGDGTEVTYVADFEFKGVTRFLAPFLRPAFKKLGDEAEKGNQVALQAL